MSFLRNPQQVQQHGIGLAIMTINRLLGQRSFFFSPRCRVQTAFHKSIDVNAEADALRIATCNDRKSLRRLGTRRSNKMPYISIYMQYIYGIKQHFHACENCRGRICTDKILGLDCLTKMV